MAAKEPAQPRVLSTTCPDEACCSRLFFPSYDLSVECPHCGQRHDRSALRNVEEVSNPGVAFHSLIRNILIGNIVPKHGEDTVKVRGLSNYHCKLVSPLLTYYGMDKRTGKARLLSELGTSAVFDCGVLCDRAFRIDPDMVDVAGYGRDVSGSATYLRGTLALVRAYNDGEDRLLPVHVDGDGHCLVHAVSRALVGRELFWHPLRCNLKRHLQEHLSKYKDLLKDFVDEQEWEAIIAECDPEFLPPEGEPLGLRNIHVFSLANVLRRPIILLDSVAGMRSLGDYAALFLPSLVDPQRCRGGVRNLCNPPLCLSWSSPGRNHYIPLVGVRYGDKLPQLPRSLLPKAWGVPQSLVDVYIDFDSNGCCIIGGDNHLSESYVRRLTVAMDEVFYEKYGVHPTVVTDVHHYIYKKTGLVGIRPSIVVRATQKALQERRLYRCLTCDAVCEHHVLPEWFHPGGLLYEQAVQSHGGLLPDKLYPFRKYGVTCWYNQEKDELIPVLSKYALDRCTLCQSAQVRRLRGDGSLELKNGDRTRTPSNSNYCSCGFKHYWDGKEYDTLPQQLTLTMEWNNKVVKDTVAWFQHESDPSLNSNVYTVAADVVNKHFPGVFGIERLLQQVVDQILEQTRLPDSVEDDRPPELEPAERDSAGMSPCKLIIRGYKTLHKEELGVSKTERRLLERIEVGAASRRKHHASSETAATSNPAVCPEKTGGAAASAISSGAKATETAVRPNFVRVVTSDGRQGQLDLGTAGVTMSQLQTWVEGMFGIVVARQQLKSGFPPRELRAPDRPDCPLPLGHGDRITVEVAREPAAELHVPQEPADGATGQDSLEASLRTMLSHIRRSGQTVWEYAQNNATLFSHGGLFYVQMKRDIGLVDGKHCHLPLIPDKVFTYSAVHDRLELCLEPHGHFAVSNDIEAKIAAGQVGCTGSHHDKSSAEGASGSSEAPPAKTLRKGPGFTVLAPEPEPDVSRPLASALLDRLHTVTSALDSPQGAEARADEARFGMQLGSSGRQQGQHGWYEHMELD